jgi:hypothetical protein
LQVASKTGWIKLQLQNSLILRIGNEKLCLPQRRSVSPSSVTQAARLDEMSAKANVKAELGSKHAIGGERQNCLGWVAHLTAKWCDNDNGTKRTRQ